MPLSVELALSDNRKRNAKVQAQVVLQIVYPPVENDGKAQTGTIEKIVFPTHSTLATLKASSPSSPFWTTWELLSMSGLPLHDDTSLYTLTDTGFKLRPRHAGAKLHEVIVSPLHISAATLSRPTTAPPPSGVSNDERMKVGSMSNIQLPPRVLAWVFRFAERARSAIRDGNAREVRAQQQKELEQLLLEANVVRDHLRDLRLTKDKLDRKAARVLGMYAWGSVAFFSLEWIAIAYGTFHIYNWDIMEPLTYLLGSFDAICAYAFFAAVRADYSAGNFVEALFEGRRRKMYRRHGFDLQHYLHLESKLHQCNTQIEIARGVLDVDKESSDGIGERISDNNENTL